MRVNERWVFFVKSDAQLKQQLQQGLTELNLDHSLCKPLLHYLAILSKWNKAYNLTAIRTPEAMIAHLALDSLSLVPYLHGERVLDVGTGAGFPGVPLALVYPHKQFVLLDSNGKKTRFLIQAIGEVGLKNVQVVQARVENYQAQDCFNVITARALGSLDDIISKTWRLLCDKGEILAMKGAYPQRELQKIHASFTVHPLKVPGLCAQRHLVCIKK